MTCIYCELHDVKTELPNNAEKCRICRNHLVCKREATIMQKLAYRQSHREFMKPGRRLYE